MSNKEIEKIKQRLDEISIEIRKWNEDKVNTKNDEYHYFCIEILTLLEGEVNGLNWVIDQCELESSMSLS